MLGHNPFYNQSIRKIISTFGNLFKNFQIMRYNDAGEPVETISVPVSWASKELWYTRMKQDPNAGSETDAKKVQVVLPRIGCELVGLNPDPKRRLSPIGRNMKMSTDPNAFIAQYNPQPWNFNFNLYVMTRNLVDGFNIVEQILCFFTPDFTVTIHELPETAIERDIPFIFQGISQDVVYEGAFDKTRGYIWTFSFLAKGHIYPPTRKVEVIKKAIVNDISNTVTPDDSFLSDDWEVVEDSV